MARPWRSCPTLRSSPGPSRPARRPPSPSRIWPSQPLKLGHREGFHRHPNGFLTTDHTDIHGWDGLWLGLPDVCRTSASCWPKSSVYIRVIRGFKILLGEKEMPMGHRHRRHRHHRFHRHRLHLTASGDHCQRWAELSLGFLTTDHTDLHGWEKIWAGCRPSDSCSPKSIRVHPCHPWFQNLVR